MHGTDYSQTEERILAFLDDKQWQWPAVLGLDHTATGQFTHGEQQTMKTVTGRFTSQERQTMNKAEQLKARLKREDELRPIIEAYIAGKPVWWRDTSRTKRWEQSQIDNGPGGLGFLPSIESIQYRLTPPPPEKLTVTLELTPSEALALLARLNVPNADAAPFVEGAVGYAECSTNVRPADVFRAFWEHKDSLAEKLAAFLKAQD